MCKDCTHEADYVWRQANPEKKLLSARRCRSIHPEKFREADLRWRKKHPEKVNKKNVIRLEQYHANKEIEQEKQRIRYANNPEKGRAKIKLWRQENPKKRSEQETKRRVLEKNVSVNDLTAAQWRAIKEIYRWRCAYCNKKTVALTQDHIIPLSKGGNHTMENIVPACRPCNSKKGNRPLQFPVQPPLALDFGK